MDHVSEQVINQHRQRQLSPTQLLDVDDHLASCKACHLLWAEGHEDPNESVTELYEDLLSADPTADEHLSYEVLEALVDDEAGAVEREIAQLHMEECSQCAAEFIALEELRDQKPIMVPTQRQAPGDSFFVWRNWPRLAVATFATLLLIAIAWIGWKARPSFVETTKTEIALSSPTPINTGSPLPSPSPSTEIVVSLRDAGRTVTLDTTGKIEGLGELSPGLNAAIKTALTTEQLNIGPAIAGLRGKSGTLMGGGANEGTPFRLLSPVGEVVQSDYPTFRWEPYEGVTVYVVKVYDSNFKELATSLSQTATSWKTPSALPRGSIYSWQVTAIKNGEEVKSPSAPAPEARFRVLAEDRLNEIKRLQNIKHISHLALGTLYAEAGLLEEARREFRILLKENPGSKVVKSLLHEVTGR